MILRSRGGVRLTRTPCWHERRGRWASVILKGLTVLSGHEEEQRLDQQDKQEEPTLGCVIESGSLPKSK